MKQKREELSSIRVNNDAEMIGLRLRGPRVALRDSNVWTKTESERKELKRWRCVKFILPSRWMTITQPSGFTGKLIVYLTNLPVGSHSKNVLSFTCDRNEIESVLLKCSRMEKNTKVLKYSWNGKTYQRGEILPRLNRGGRISA